jgi:putative transposase
MGRTPRAPTLWHVPDRLWSRIDQVLESHEPKKSQGTRGRPRVDRRRILDGIIFQLRTGCQWNHIPPIYGSDSTIHRYFRIWSESGVLAKIWEVLVVDSPELAKVWAPPTNGPAKGDGPGDDGA